MREILFRGKVIESTVKEVGEWVYGHLVVRKDHDDGPEQCFICEEGHKFIRCLNKMPCTYKVDPETVGQYTDLTDKNGKRIFEGDIVQIWWFNPNDEDKDEEPAKYKAVIEFGNPNCEYNWGWQLKAIDYIPYNKSILLWVDMKCSGAHCEVIGNIHDNQELLDAEVEG